MTGALLFLDHSPQRQQRRISEIRIPGSGFPQAVSSPAGGTGGRVERVGSATAFFLHLGRRPAKNAAQHFAKSFCPVAPSVFAFVHAPEHGERDEQDVAKNVRGLAHVCS